MPDYKKSKIYKICDLNEEMIYIGSTVKKLYERLSQHKYNYKKYLEDKKIIPSTVFKIFEKYGLENCKIYLLEEFPCENKEQLLKKEGEYIKNINCVNKCIAGRTEKEWKEDNKEKIKILLKEYKKNNRKKINEYLNEYYHKNKEKINNRNKEYKKKYFEENKDILKEKRSQKIECDICHNIMTKGSISRHKKNYHS